MEYVDNHTILVHTRRLGPRLLVAHERVQSFLAARGQRRQGRGAEHAGHEVVLRKMKTLPKLTASAS